jgi:O-antigen/teichoic acid export membrane protein
MTFMERLFEEKFMRYILAVGGTAGVAAANFAMSGLLIAYTDAADFGSFAYMQVLIALGFGLSNAVLGSPLMYYMNKEKNHDKALLNSYFKVNFWFCAFFGLSLFFIAKTLPTTNLTNICFAFLGTFSVARWFGRSYNNSRHSPHLVVLSDIAYSVMSIIGTFLLWFVNELTVLNVLCVQMVAVITACFFLGFDLLRLQITSLWHGQIMQFSAGFREKGKHSLVGVITTEATANAHSYLVVTLLGPVFFAPIAAAAILYRPIPLLISTLTQLERPRLAKYLGNKQLSQALSLVKRFHIILLLTVFANIVLAFAAFTWFAPLVLQESYNPNDVYYAVLLWTFIFALRCVRGPFSAFLQANGQFKSLSLVTIKSAAVGLPAVFLAIHWLGAVASLLGILLAELVAVWFIVRLMLVTKREFLLKTETN